MSGKTVLTEEGPARIDVPRDRESSFEPLLIPKHERRFTGFDEKFVAMYARGMTVREIQGFLAEQYGTAVRVESISSVTEAVMAEVTAWQSRSLEPTYPVVFFDALRVKIREDAVVRNKAHLRECSQTRHTRQPALRSSLSTNLSRLTFRDSFCSQNALLFSGTFECKGHWCQKHPSANTATRSAVKTKSGRTIRRAFPSRFATRGPSSRLMMTWRRHPLMPTRLKAAASASSVVLFPCPRIRDITCERFLVSKTSATRPPRQLRFGFGQVRCRGCWRCCQEPSARGIETQLILDRADTYRHVANQRGWH